MHISRETNVYMLQSHFPQFINGDGQVAVELGQYWMRIGRLLPGSIHH